MLKSALDEIAHVNAIGKPWLQTHSVVDAKNVVDRERLEAALAKVRARVRTPENGLFGPDSMIWKIYGEQLTAIGGGRALLLQTAHPYIAHAVQQKSAYRTDPAGRNERTMRAVVDWVFGDLDRAFGSARTVFRVHTHIVGSIANRVGPYDAGDRYAANEQHSQFWVHATGVDSAVRLYEHVYGPLSREELERYNEESNLFALLFGIDEAMLPPTWGDFREYVDRMLESDVLTPDQASLDIAKYVLTPPTPQLAGAMAWFKLMTAGLLPPRIRHGYRFRWGAVEERMFEASMVAIRRGIPMLPPALRYSMHYRRARHRAERTKPGRLERRVDEAFLRAAAGAVKPSHVASPA